MKRKKESFTEKDILTEGWHDYQLLDSGDRLKLEQFGKRTLIRFEPEAEWEPVLGKEKWRQADAMFTLRKGQQSGTWQFNRKFAHEWTLTFDKIKILVSISNSRHLGIFPEQHQQWNWIEEKVASTSSPPSILNLFAYTGISTLFAAKGGTAVTHVDAAKGAVRWAKHNLEINGMAEKPIRWMVDDALKFTSKEIRRGKQYDGIILDPPAFGRGPNGEVWNFSRDIELLIQQCIQLLGSKPLFLICTVYNVNMPIRAIAKMIVESELGRMGVIEYGDLIQKEKSAGRKVKQASYVCWSQ